MAGRRSLAGGLSHVRQEGVSGQPNVGLTGSPTFFSFIGSSSFAC